MQFRDRLVTSRDAHFILDRAKMEVVVASQQRVPPIIVNLVSCDDTKEAVSFIGKPSLLLDYWMAIRCHESTYLLKVRLTDCTKRDRGEL